MVAKHLKKLINYINIGCVNKNMPNHLVINKREINNLIFYKKSSTLKFKIL